MFADWRSSFQQTIFNTNKDNDNDRSFAVYLQEMHMVWCYFAVVRISIKYVSKASHIANITVRS